MRLIKPFLILLLLVIVVSCSNDSTSEESEKKEELEEETLAGFVLQIEEKRFLMIDDEDKALYNELKDLSMEKILQMELEGPLVYVNYPNVDELEKGDEVLVKYDGVMTFSIPGQINASKVTKVE